MLLSIRGTNGCLAAGTLIDCPRNLIEYPRGIPIEDLVGKRFLTYSWDLSKDTFTLSQVTKVWCVGKRRTYRVVVSAYQTKNKVGFKSGGSGKGRYLPPCELVGTYEHLVMLSDGTWKKLGELKPGDSLKSLYRRHTDRGKLYWTTNVVKTQENYGTPYGPVKNIFTYQGVTKPVSEQQFVCAQAHGPRPGTEKEFQVHHKNENPYDHSPKNLEWKDTHKHQSDHLKARRALGPTGWEVTGVHPRGMAGKKHTDSTLGRIGAASMEIHKQRRDPRFYDDVWMREHYPRCSLSELNKILRVSTALIKTRLKSLGIKLVGLRAREVLNHRVLETPVFVGSEKVYDMEVAQTKNFVANGMVVHNSGKTTIVRAILDQFKGVPIYGVLGPRRPEAYALKVKGVPQIVYVLGSYHTISGGCDQVQPYQLILELIEKYAAKGHVLFEGVIVSSSYGRVGRLLEKWGQEAVMAFLTTSLEDCLKNVQKRRNARDDAREFNPKNTTSKYNQILKSRTTIAEAGKLRVVDIDPNKGVAQVLSLLREAS